MVTVRFIGSLRNESKRQTLRLQTERSISLRELIDIIARREPQLKRALIDHEQGDPKPRTLILVNAREISALDDLETLIKNEDEVVFVPVVHGG